MYYGKCFLCGRWGLLEEHHIFGGANRKLSEKYGLKVGLCGISCHREGPEAAHRCAETAQMLHEYGQKKFMNEQGATIDEFRAVFGKNYLEVPMKFRVLGKMTIYVDTVAEVEAESADEAIQMASQHFGGEDMEIEWKEAEVI